MMQLDFKGNNDMDKKALLFICLGMAGMGMLFGSLIFMDTLPEIIWICLQAAGTVCCLITITAAVVQIVDTYKDHNRGVGGTGPV